MRTLITAILLCLLLLIPIGCKKTTPADTATLGQEYQLAIGQTISFSQTDLMITFKEVIEDSRCPSDVICIWAGRVSCLLDITISNETNKTVLTQSGLSDMYATEQYKQYTIQFRVEPYPQSSSKIQNSDYRLFLTVSPLP